MKITFLGTGTSQGVPLIACTCEVCTSEDSRDKRLRTSILLEFNDIAIVVDTGPDFRQQMLREKVKRLDAVLFTHEHKDHIAGLDDIRAFNFILKRKIDVYASDRVQDAIRREFAYIFSDTKYPGIPEIELHTIQNKPFEIQGIPVIPIEVLHYKLSVFAFRFGDFVYITDANAISQQEKKKIMGCKILVINALRRQAHVSHFTLQEALDLIAELKPEKAYLTHISHQLGKHSNIEKELPSGVFQAYDGLQIQL
ncbi:MAG: MBL fold metallo-hydrolase [Bacteroidetes bacterium]|nr:MBL fold metallo-hydrolase [Bacteroidota bacterium]MBK9801085.1 MBL fold metallo-hydrolase [Bacteroidota bacterium]